MISGKELMTAIKNNAHPLVVRELIQKSAPIDYKQDGFTPLMCAAKNNQYPALITILVDVGVDINARDQSGRTALIWAAEYSSNPEVVLTLIEEGARIDIYDNTQRRALEYVFNNRYLHNSRVSKTSQYGNKVSASEKITS